jgi:hypothetical protein
MRLVYLAMLSFLSVVLVAGSVVRVSSSSILAIETLTSIWVISTERAVLQSYSADGYSMLAPLRPNIAMKTTGQRQYPEELIESFAERRRQ